MSHAFPRPRDVPRLAAQYRMSKDSDEWLDTRYRYTPTEVRVINGHYGWEKFRIKPGQKFGSISYL